MILREYIHVVNDWILGWPLTIYVLAIGLLYTLALKGIQFRYFFRAWKITLYPDAGAKNNICGDMSPLQAFISTLSANLGNGSIAGMATALYVGGPGAAIWIVITGFLLMSIRFAEVYISTLYGAQISVRTTLGGPMLYLKRVIGGRMLSYLYALCTLFFGLVMGNAVQANSIGLSMTTTWGISPWINAGCMFVFIIYVLLGGAPRIVKASDRIVPLKVMLFFVSTFVVLLYHYQSLWNALHLMMVSAFTPQAALGGMIGFSLLQAMRSGIFYSIMATESGLGTAAILFGFTGSQNPVTSGFLGMISTFVSTIVCFIVTLCIVASGVWDSGFTSTALTIKSFETVFSHFGGWIVSFLSISFGIGVLIAYAYITRAAWLFLTNGRLAYVFIPLYSISTFLGALTKVDIIWQVAELTNASMLIVNLFGLLYLLPEVKRSLPKFLSQLDTEV